MDKDSFAASLAVQRRSLNSIHGREESRIWSNKRNSVLFFTYLTASHIVVSTDEVVKYVNKK
jgi:hypothetical protein